MAYPISDVPRRIVYSGSAGVGPYAFTFEVLAATDIAVYKNGTLLTLTTDYTVSINTGTGTGTITLMVAATGSDQITLVGDRAIERTSDFVTGGDLFANTLNTELDSLTIFAQQVDEKADRAIKAPVTDPTTINMTLPAQATRASKALGFNASGNPTQSSSTLAAIDAAVTTVQTLAAAAPGSSAGISHIASGTGAVATTVQAKLRESVSPMDFGAASNTVAGLAAMTATTLTTGTRIRVDEGYLYEVANPGATDHDATTAGGVKLYVIPQMGEIWDRAFFETNDADRINKAVQRSITLFNTGMLNKVMVQGLYTLDKPLQLLRFNGTLFDFVTICIEAPAPGYISNKRTTFLFTDKQNPGIVTQGARKLVIKNISIVGTANNLVLPSYDDLLDRNGWWNVNGAVDIGSQRVYTGICVDPFTSATPVGERFPYFDGSGTNPNYYVMSAFNGRGSSSILIENCEVQGWIRAINCAGSSVQLGDVITIEKCNLSYNRISVLIGESQNRGIHINECQANGFDIFLASGPGFGEGTGSGGYINGGVLVFGYAVVAVDTNRGPGACTNLYAESIWTIGSVLGSIGWQFTNCNLKLIGNWNGRGVAAALMGGNGNVTFDGGFYGIYNNLPHQISLNAQFTVQGGAAFNSAPVVTNLASGGYFNWVDGIFQAGSGGGRKISQRIVGAFGTTLAAAAYSLPGMPWQESDDPGYWECLTRPYIIFISNATVTKDVNGVVTLNGIDATNIFVNDTLVSATSQVISDNRIGTISAQFYTMGYVSSIDVGASTCVLSGGAVDLEVGKSYSVYIYRYPTIRRPRRASMTSGSNILTDAGIVVADWIVGQGIRGDGIPANTRVAAVVAGQITLTKNATATQTTDIYDGLFMPTNLRRAAAPVSGNWPTGAFVANASPPTKDANNMMLSGWLCTAGGVPGTWEPVYWSAVTPAN